MESKLFLTNITKQKTERRPIVIFELSNGSKVKGEIYDNDGFTHINLSSLHNSYIFRVLGINNPKQFVSNIVGYPTNNGDWPYVKNIGDLSKVLYHLLKMNKSSMYSSVSTRYPLDQESDKQTVNITVKKKHHSKLNFKL